MKVSICLVIFRVILAVGFFLAFYFSSCSVATRDEEFSGLVQNWKTNLLGDFGTIDKTWKGFFSGTVEGCRCYFTDSESGVWSGLHRHICSYNETYAGCDSIYQTPKVEVTKWTAHGIVDSPVLKQIANSSFLELHTRMNVDGTCKQGSKHCGNRESLSKGLCVPNEWLSCPFTVIDLEDSIDLRASSDRATFNKIANSQLVASSSPAYNPIVDLKIAEHSMCLNPKYKSITPGRNPYILMRSKIVKNCLKDSRYEVVDEIGEKMLFDNNRVEYNHLPEFHTSDNYKWRRMYRRIVEWKPLCLDLVPDVLDIHSNLKNMSNTHSILYWVSFFFILILIGLQVYGYLQVAQNQDKRKIVLFSWIRIAIITCMILILIPGLVKGYPAANEINRIVEQDCTDRLTDIILKRTSATLHFEYYLFSMFSFCLWIFMMASDNIELVWNRMRFESKKRSEGLPTNIADISDTMSSFTLFVSVVTSLS